jgi:TonB family protein
MRTLFVVFIVSLFQLHTAAGQTDTNPGQTATASPELAEATRLSRDSVKLYEEKKFDAALPLAKRAVELREKALGPDHELLASSLNNVAGIYLATEKFGDAESLYKRSLGILEKKFGTESKYLLNTLESLALTRFVQRNYGDAEKLYLRALAIREKAFGPQHLETARYLSFLGGFYERTNKPAKAADYYKRSLAIEEKALGPNDPDLAETLDNCACALISDEPDEAKRYQERASKIRNSTGNDTIKQSSGLLQGSAALRVQPEYPFEAKKNRAQGSVLVEVVVDECGRVINARALSGPNDLKAAAVSAARQWRFTRTKLARRPVKVIGTITFNFHL